MGLSTSKKEDKTMGGQTISGKLKRSLNIEINRAIRDLLSAIVKLSGKGEEIESAYDKLQKAEETISGVAYDLSESIHWNRNLP